jgi:hypothetical protein
VASHHLIDTYLGALAKRLPADTVDELADGLIETFQRHLAGGEDRETAAAMAIAEFGEPDVVLTAFVRQAPGRRIARVLLYSGPIVGLCWATTLAVSHAWTWPVPEVLRVAFAVTLLAVVATLIVAATGLRSYRRTRLAAHAGLGLIALDSAMLATVALVAPPFVWPMALAIPASLTRIALTTRSMPPLLAR